MFGFGYLAPKPLTVSAKTETLATPFYRNRKQAESAETDGKRCRNQNRNRISVGSLLCSR